MLFLLNKKVAAAKYQYGIAKRAGISRRKYYDSVHSSLSSITSKCNNKIMSPSTNKEPAQVANTIQLSKKVKRPIMHTFFEPAYGKDNLVVELNDWDKAWTDAGWKTSVLTLTDAQRHPYFKRFKRAFDNAKYKVDDCHRMHFYRWLAMAASGGGWISDVSCICIKQLLKYVVRNYTQTFYFFFISSMIPCLYIPNHLKY